MEISGSADLVASPVNENAYVGIGGLKRDILVNNSHYYSGGEIYQAPANLE